MGTPQNPALYFQFNQLEASLAASVFVINELIPLQKRIGELNNWVDSDIITFNEYEKINK